MIDFQAYAQSMYIRGICDVGEKIRTPVPNELKWLATINRECNKCRSGIYTIVSLENIEIQKLNVHDAS